VRLLAILAGLAWLMGLHPALPVRLLVVAIVVDALADAGRNHHNPNFTFRTEPTRRRRS